MLVSYPINTQLRRPKLLTRIGVFLAFPFPCLATLFMTYARDQHQHVMVSPESPQNLDMETEKVEKVEGLLVSIGASPPASNYLHFLN